jgi:hypothetical protein
MIPGPKPGTRTLHLIKISSWYSMLQLEAAKAGSGKFSTASK